MKTTRYFLLIVALLIFCPLLYAKSPFVVYKASRGVILQSSKDGSLINDPVRGTPVYDDDMFILNDEHYSIKIKEVNSGEIYTFSGKDKITAIDIANQQKYNLFDGFLRFLLSQSKEFGFNTSPVLTSQCVTSKGGTNESASIDSISNVIALNITEYIQSGQYYNGVVAKKEFTDEEMYSYVVTNKDTSTYALVLYTVSKENMVVRHNDVIAYVLDDVRPSKIELIPLPGNNTLKLDYFCMSNDDDRTCYVILFNRSDFYKELNKSSFYDYMRLINWEIIERELIYQGNVERVLYIK